eukprot:CAMPEP_0203764398 /NCGR_PEP_ID=MMETSP0098-20131031/17661_1 /ASSEMBLY_ACC=CAM_ASM_000208 /TAXON_ID=96639 /ORGANISM=" , Strain NY0313808BC1" /LENGTH=250 /DNA_ID=CAMNT_0050660239 /DNA_START=19 /DNA_END=768 /DNA_ORIENTATION=-
MDTIYRRSQPDDHGLVTQVVYEPCADAPGTFNRRVEKIKLFRMNKQRISSIEARRKLERFGAAAGAQGAERGITMVAHDECSIEDPLGEEASKTGEERLIEKLKATVKQNRTEGRHDPDSFGEDFDTFISSRAQSAAPNSRPGSNQRSRYTPSPHRNRNNNSPYRNSGQGASPSRNNNHGRTSPGFHMNNRQGGRNSPGYTQKQGGRNSPGYTQKKSSRSPAASYQRNTNRNTSRSPSGQNDAGATRKKE